MGGATGAGPAVTGRVRSRTFEEYEKYTTDAWDDEEEDISRLSVPSELENELRLQHREAANSDSAVAPTRRRAGGKGKGKLLPRMCVHCRCE